MPLPERHPNYSGGPVARSVVREVAEHLYEPADIEAGSILRYPKHANSWNIGQVRVEVRDEGDGRLSFKINATKEPTWAAFDLEEALAGENLSGPKEIKPLPFREYTPEEFSEAMISALKTFRTTADPWWRSHPTPSEMVRVDHPMWENPSAVKALLTAAPTKELVHAINFMERRSYKDRAYLRRLESIDSTLLGLGNHESPEVRDAFGFLLWENVWWPRDVHILEPLLKSTDTNVQSQVLGAFANRREVPQDIERVRELAGSDDSSVRFHAERLLQLEEVQ